MIGYAPTFVWGCSSQMSDLRAALDLGSNSFHLLLVRPEGSGFVVVERLKEKVQLAAGFRDGELHGDAIERGSACLRRFAQRLSEVAPEHVHIVGTYALRKAANQHAFTKRVEEIIGRGVDVVSGEEEARLVYLGVAHHVPQTGADCLVVDIGGGSTEIACGKGALARVRTSIEVGCVALTDQEAAGRADRASAYAALKAAARKTLERHLGEHPLLREPLATFDAFGTSGTIESIAMVLASNGWGGDGVTREGLRRLEEAIVADRWMIDAGLPGLARDRVDIFPAGAAILSACFEVLGLERLRFVDVSLMQGVICDALGTRIDVDRRAESVLALAGRFGIDKAQSARVRRTAEALYAQSSEWWRGDDESLARLRWAADLHELGVHIGARHYHRHGAYVVRHSDLPGFSSVEKRALAILVRGHRRSFPLLAFRAFEPELADTLKRLVTLLRIAVILERSHSDRDSPDVDLEVEGDRMVLRVEQDWLAEHPLSAKELQVEVGQLENAGLELVLGE